ncbi:hypothetical protein DL96DRAFT_1560596 [Flagelloscypha sp. PMI_526]|nr:hypothetical protein DL96DRAFT_1560596 [Flagelloscypha sp. PMI_526]
MSSAPVLPLELIWRIVSLVRQDSHLQACSLVSTGFVEPAQRELFKAIWLDSEHTPARLVSILQSSPHLAAYITSLTLEGCPSNIVELLPLLTKVHHLRLIGYEFHDWTGPMLAALQQVMLPQITHLGIDDVAIPVRVIAACSQLLHLSVQLSDIEDDSDLGIAGLAVPLSSFYPIQILCLDRIRNSSGERSSLFTDMIESGHFSSVRCLRLPSSGFQRHEDDLMENELSDLLEPFRDSITCLDIHYWLIPGHFLNLKFFQVSMRHRGSSMSPGKETVSRLSWLAGMITDLEKPHPLSILLLDDACEYWPWESESQEAAEGHMSFADFQKAWIGLDEALNARFASGTRELKLPQLETVGIPLQDWGTAPRLDEVLLVSAPAIIMIPVKGAVECHSLGLVFGLIGTVRERAGNKQWISRSAELCDRVKKERKLLALVSIYLNPLI